MTSGETERVRRPARARPGLYLLRSLLVGVAFVVAYFVLPFDSQLTASTSTLLVGGLVLVGGVLAWQVRAITRSPYPKIRAIGSLGLTFPLFLVVFSATYYVMGRSAPDTWSQPLTRLDAMYFTVTTFATVGYGDITAVTESARAIVTVQMLGDLVFIGLVTRFLVQVVQGAVARRNPPTGDPR